MLSAILTRGFKCYKDVTFVPCSEGDMFSLFVGDNGVGKSAIMEGLEFFFNSSEWNMNQDVTGSQRDSAFFGGLFEITQEIIDNVNFDANDIILMNAIVSKIHSVETSKFGTSTKDPRIAYKEVFEFYNKDKNKIIIPIQRAFNSNKYELHTLGGVLNNENSEQAQELIEKIISNYKYIYIPVELKIEDFLRIESSAFQSLRNEELYVKISNLLSDSKTGGASILDQINSELAKYLGEIESSIKSYSIEYSISSEKRKKDNVYAKHLTTDIIDGFFGKKYFRKNGKPIDDLSSGERRLMLIDIIAALLHQRSANPKIKKQSLILSIDEPEASLHVSRMFTQFKKIFNFSKQNVQIFAISHWYGAIPIIPSGTLIQLESHFGSIKTYSLRDFFVDNSREKPTLRTKSFFDFASSIFLSLKDNDSKYLIVEGVEDVNYLQNYLPDIQIIPTGGITKSIKIYELLHSMYDDAESNLKGKVFFLTDTDLNQHAFDNVPKELKKDFDRFIPLRRLQICESEKKINLLKISDKKVVSPPTAIEDVLDPDLFYQVMAEYLEAKGYDFKSKFKYNINCFHSGIGKKYGPFMHKGSPDDRDADEEYLSKILSDKSDKKGTNERKEEFSKNYFDKATTSSYIPPWILELTDFFK